MSLRRREVGVTGERLGSQRVPLNQLSIRVAQKVLSPRFRLYLPCKFIAAFILAFLLGLDSVSLNASESHIDVRELLREEVNVKIAGRTFSHDAEFSNGKGVGKKPERFNLHTYQLPWYTIDLVGVQSIQLLARIPKDVRDYWCADPSPPSQTTSSI